MSMKLLDISTFNGFSCSRILQKLTVLVLELFIKLRTLLRLEEWSHLLKLEKPTLEYTYYYGRMDSYFIFTSFF